MSGWPEVSKEARVWIDQMQSLGRPIVSIDRAEDLVAALEAAEAQRDTLAAAIKEALLRAGIGPGAAEILRAALTGIAPPEAET